MKRQMKAFLAFLMCTFAILAPMSGAYAYSGVTVKPGDTMWSLANTHHVSLHALEAANPSVAPSDLRIGTKLNLPAGQQTYVVKPGDSMWSIARHKQVALSSLIAANPGIQAANLVPGTKLQLPGPSAAAKTYSSQDLYWMARVINAEAQGESLKAQIGVGDVVLHRMENPQYPNSVYGVVFQNINGHYQFTCVPQGTIYDAPTGSAYQAAKDVLQRHLDVVPGSYVFYNPSKTPAGSWVWNQPTIARIGHFIFAK